MYIYINFFGFIYIYILFHLDSYILKIMNAIIYTNKYIKCIYPVSRITNACVSTTQLIKNNYFKYK